MPISPDLAGFVADGRQTDKTDCFIPCACARGKNCPENTAVFQDLVTQIKKWKLCVGQSKRRFLIETQTRADFDWPMQYFRFLMCVARSWKTAVPHTCSVLLIQDVT